MKITRTLITLLLMTSIAPATEIVAHRGYSALAPENTLAAFRLAWEKGTDACENDIYLTTDQQLVVIHDKDTKRTAGLSLDVAKSSAAQLLSLDVGSWKGAQWSGEKLPTLQQCLDTMPQGKQRFFIEIKVGPEIVPALQQVLEPMQDRAAQLAVISFNHAAAVLTKTTMPWLQVYFLASGKTKAKQPRTDLAELIADAKLHHFDGLDLGADWPWSEALVKQVHEAGLKLYVWTVDKPEDIRKLAQLGVDGITTNDPVTARSALAER
jgi:glycerophosphoryl diester phosphodiesterase